MTPPATEPARGWTLRYTWNVVDPDMVHPRHTYETKPSWGLADRTARDAWEAAHQGLTLVSIDMREGSDGAWQPHLTRPLAGAA